MGQVISKQEFQMRQQGKDKKKGIQCGMTDKTLWTQVRYTGKIRCTLCWIHVTKGLNSWINQRKAGAVDYHTWGRTTNDGTREETKDESKQK